MESEINKGSTFTVLLPLALGGSGCRSVGVEGRNSITQLPHSIVSRLAQQCSFTKQQGAVDVISGGDRISGEHVAELSTVLEARLGHGQPQIVLDLQSVALIDSAGLELLLDFQEKCQRMGGAMKLANAERLVSRSAKGDGRRRPLRNVS